MPATLIFDTSTSLDFIALILDEKLHFSIKNSHSHTSTLLLEIRAILEKNKIRINDLDLIVVGQGPGSFTGIRIAISTARALSQVLKKELIPISSLELYFIGYRATDENNLTELNCLWIPFIDARKGRVYAGGFSRQGPHPSQGSHPSRGERIFPEGDYLPEQILLFADKWKAISQNHKVRLFNPDPLWYNNDSHRKKPLMPFSKNEILQFEFNQKTFLSGISEKIQNFRQKKGIGDFSTAKPVYLRKSDAEIFIKKKVTTQLKDMPTSQENNNKMPNNNWKKTIEKTAFCVRKRVLNHVLENNGGYLSQACSAAEILSALYLKIMKLPPTPEPLKPLPFPGVPSKDNRAYFTGYAFNGERHPDCDRFYLSPAHYALVLYAVLIETGRMSSAGLEYFNRDGSSVEMIGAEHSPGMEVMTGSLGQGLSQAAGSAMGRRRKGEKGRNWIFMSDGEFQIGQTWETMQVLCHYKLDNIGIYVDVNLQQCDGLVSDVMNIDPLDEKLRAFGARVSVVDGHDIEALVKPSLQQQNGQPLVVLARTDPCRGVTELSANAPKLHYLRFKNNGEKEMYRKALRRMLV